MPIPTGIENLSTTPASNNPAGSENVSEGDDHLRNLYAFLRQSFTAGADIASASTITPPSTGGSFNLTGTTTVTAIATTNSWSGRKIRFRHTGAHSFTQSSSLVCPGGVSITFANGDISEWAQNPSGGWEIVTYVPVLYISAPYFNATGSAVPANGIYLSSANTLTFSSASTLRGSVNATGNWVIAAPSSGAHSIQGANATNYLTVGTAVHPQVFSFGSTNGGNASLYFTEPTTTICNLGTNQSVSLSLDTGGVSRVVLTSAGNVTIAAPSSGNTLATTVVDGAFGLTITGSGNNASVGMQMRSGNAAKFAYIDMGRTGSDLQLGVANGPNAFLGGTVAGDAVLEVLGANSLWFGTGATGRVSIGPVGNVTVAAPTSGVALTVSAVSGTHSTKIADSATNSFDAGFLVLPVSGSTTAALSDRGKGIVATGTITIPNATFAAGDVLAIYNNSGASITLTATITTMRLHGTATTGSRTLAQRGFASVYFVSGTECVVTGDVT